MRYLTFAEYSADVGGTLDEAAFNRNIDRACGVIDNATFNRIEAMEVIPSQVKALCRDLIEYFDGKFGSSGQISSRSQSAGNVSESESFVIRSIEERAGEINDMVFDYLGMVTDDKGTPVLYRGCSR